MSGGRPARAAAAGLVGLVAAGLLEAWLARRSAAPGGILDRRGTLAAEVAAMWGAYGLALACLRHVPRRAAVVSVLLLAVVLRLASFSAKAPLSDDLYRYAWDGTVQLSGTDPYRYPPDATELRGLRDDWLWPPELAEKERVTLLNRPGVRTIYPPVAEAWFVVERLVVPQAARDRGYEAAGLLLDLAVLAVLLSLLRRAGRDPRAVALYALAPLPVLEAVQNAHVDVLAVLLVLGAVAAGARRTVLTAVALTAAALVKVYPGLLLALLLRPPRRGLLVAGVAGALTVLAYLPHVLAVGPQVIGYLPGYLQEEHYDEGTRYLLVSLLGLGARSSTAVVAGALLVLLAVLLRARLPFPPAAVRLLAGVLLLTTPVQPWYFLLLLALATAHRRPVGGAAVRGRLPAVLRHHPGRPGGRARPLVVRRRGAVVAGAGLLVRHRTGQRRSGGGQRSGGGAGRRVAHDALLLVVVAAAAARPRSRRRALRSARPRAPRTAGRRSGSRRRRPASTAPRVRAVSCAREGRAGRLGVALGVVDPVDQLGRGEGRVDDLVGAAGQQPADRRPELVRAVRHDVARLQHVAQRRRGDRGLGAAGGGQLRQRADQPGHRRRAPARRWPAAAGRARTPSADEQHGGDERDRAVAQRVAGADSTIPATSPRAPCRARSASRASAVRSAGRPARPRCRPARRGGRAARARPAPPAPG